MMAAKKKTKEEAPQAGATQTKRATADNVAPIEQGPVVHPPGADPVETPVPELGLSSDNRHSSYETNNEPFPPDQGNQVVELPGKPTAVKE